MTVGLPVAGSNGGFFTISADGTVIFDPASAFDNLGPAEFRDTGVTVTVADAAGATTTATVIARVRASASANPAPVILAPLSDRAVTAGVAINPFSIAAAFGDAGDTLAFSAVGLPAGLSIDAASGIVSGTPTAGPGRASVLVTATDTAGQTAVTSFAVTVDAAPAAPVLLGPPAITGTAVPGATLSVVPGRWAGRPVPDLTYQWRRNGVPISGATGPSHVVGAADAGASLTVEETAANSEGNASAVSVAVSVAGGGAPVAAGALPDQSYIQGVAVAPFDTGADFTGTGLGFALAPSSAALPSGLGLDPATGVISGTPTEASGARAIIIRASNGAGFADSGFSLTVAAADSTAPSLASAFPANGATGVAASVAPVLSFSEPVRLGTGTVILRDVLGGVDVETFDAATSGQLAVSGADLTITPSAPFQPGTAYAVRISPGAIEDLAGNPFAGIADDTTLSFTTAVPSSAANFTAVNADGWTATYPSPPAVVNAGTDNALVTPEAFTVIRAGFDAAGSATTFNEDLMVMARKRLAWPNQTSLTADQVTLSDFIYAGDTVSGAANNSTLAAPKPIAMWLNRDLEVATDPQHTVRLAVAHRHARNGRPVAAVKFTATDGTNTVSTTVSSMTKVTYSNGSGLSAPCFEGTLDLGVLTPGQLVTVDAVIYPWVGSAFTVSSDADTYPSQNLTILKVYNAAVNPVYAYVNATTGNDTTGVASTTPASAGASPFMTVRAAILAAQTANADFPGTAANCIIRLTDDAEHAKGDWRSGVVNGPVPLIIENDPANAGKAVLNDSGSESVSNLLVVRGITLKATGNNAIMFDSAASGTIDLSHLLALESCTFDASGFSPWAAWVWRPGRVWLSDCDGVMPNLAGNFGGVQKMINAVGSTGVLGACTYNAVACKGEAINDAIKGAGDLPAGEGMFFGWNFVSLNADGSQVVSFTKFISDRGLALVGNVIEQSGGPTNNAYGVSHDGVTVAARNVVAMQNTIVGARSNVMYQDSGTTTIVKDGVDRFSVHWQGNTKTDVFGTDGNLVGNWPVVHRVGHRALALLTGDAGDNGHTVGSWAGEVGSLDGVIGTSAAPVNADWTNDASSVAAGGSGLGNGDYRPGASTALPQIAAGLAPYPFDQNGAAVANDGSARVGALQP